MAHTDVPWPARMVLVFGTPSIPEGHLVKGLLESEGITVQIKGESEGPYRMGPVYLWVPEAFEVQARLIIEEAGSGGAALDEDQDMAELEDLDPEMAEEERPEPPAI